MFAIEFRRSNFGDRINGRPVSGLGRAEIVLKSQVRARFHNRPSLTGPKQPSLGGAIGSF